jgi:hypothetical protein
MQLLIAEGRSSLARDVRERRLHKRAVDLPASEVPSIPEPWISDDPDLVERVEDALAAEVGLATGELLLDFPARANMLSVHLPLRLRDGRVVWLTDEGRAGHLGLPRIASELYRSAQRLRVFTARPASRPLDGVVTLLALPAEEVRRRLAGGVALLP